METTESMTERLEWFKEMWLTENGVTAQLLYFIGIIFIVFGFFMQPSGEIIQGLMAIQLAPSNLVTDYFGVGGIGATFINAGGLMVLYTFVVSRNNKVISSTLVAGLLTVVGFAFFGKNFYNSLPISFGTWLYSRYRGIPFNQLLLTALFATTLAPVVSIISFGQVHDIWMTVPAGILVGVGIGFVISPLASSFLRFHQGYSLYNIGFTGGVVGMILVSVMRVLDFEVSGGGVSYTENSPAVFIFFIIINLLLIAFGILGGGWNRLKFRELTHETGQLISDFMTTHGPGVTLINMGLLGMMSLLYVYMVGGVLGGAVIGGYLTVVGFGAFGKHVRNVIPVVAGIFLMQVLMPHDYPGSTASLLAALFGTTLAPIAGHFGWFPGIIAGMLHSSVVLNIGITHAGLNLYNNGFTGGFIAAAMVPFLDAMKERKEEHARISEE